MKKKVLFISHSSSMYGAERSLLQILTNINSDKFSISLALPYSGPLNKALPSGIEVHYIECPYWFKSMEKFNFIDILKVFIKEIIALFKLILIVKKYNIDLIYTNSISNFTGIFASVILRKQHVWHIREILEDRPVSGQFKSFIPHAMVYKLISYSGIIISNSNATAKYLPKTEKLNVVYNAVDLREDAHFDSLLSEGWGDEMWTFMQVGSLSPKKAQHLSIKAFKIIESKIPTSKLLIIGWGRDESYIAYLKELVKSLKLENKVFFTGYLNNVPKIMSKGKILLMPSYIEPFGRAAIEAMAAGLLVIASNTGGLREIIIEGDTGFLFEAGSYIDLSKKMLYAINNPNISKKVAISGKRDAFERFSLSKYINTIETIISQ